MDVGAVREPPLLTPNYEVNRMSEQEHYQLPNPNFPNGDFEKGTRETPLPEEGVKAIYSPLKDGGEWRIRALLFDGEKFGSQEQCEQWVKEHKDELKSVRSRHYFTKVLSLDKVADPDESGTTPSEDDLTLINRFALEPLTADQVYTRSMYLANDQVDRSFERFSRQVLKQFNESAVGKSFLIGHDYRSAPEGLFFKSEMVRRNGVTYLKPTFYLVKTPQNEHLRKQIDGGSIAM